MKKHLISIFLILAAAASYAEMAKMRFRLTQSPEEFTINYIETSDMTLIESKENPDVAITKSNLIW